MQGWFGLARQLLFTLSTVNADRDEEGRYKIVGHDITHGLDPEEVVVHAETCYLVGGQPRSLAGLMASTSYGFKAAVI